MPGFSFGTEMKVRMLIAEGDDYKDAGYQLHRWPGPPAGLSRFFDPKLRTNATLKSQGIPWGMFKVGFPRPDTRVLLYQRMARAAGAGSAFVTQPGTTTRGVPAVFVPTSQANSYGGRGSF